MNVCVAHLQMNVCVAKNFGAWTEKVGHSCAMGITQKGNNNNINTKKPDNPIFTVPKQNPGDFTMVGDYRALNNVTQPDRYPLPYLADFVDITQGALISAK